MTSHTEYLIRTGTYNILLLILYLLKIDEKYTVIGGFYCDLMMILDSGLLYGPLYIIIMLH